MDFDDDEDVFTEQNLEVLDQTVLQFHNEQSAYDSDDSVVLPLARSIRRRRILSESEDEILPETTVQKSTTPNWSEPKGYQQSIIPFTEIAGMKPFNLRSTMCNSNPEDFYSLLVTDEIFENIVLQTNLFAEQKLLRTTRLKTHSRLRDWKQTDKNEIKTFFGLVLYMGLVKLPKLSDYWSNDPMFEQKYVKNKISRNRFELLLCMLHFTNNEVDDRSDRLYKIKNLVETLNKNFEHHYTPKESICVDESMVPFRGRIIFRQYNKQKRHKYGIKVFKLCSVPGYTCKLQIYAGKNDNVYNTPTNVVLSLCNSILNKGHTLYTDNWYTSVNLAETLLKNETHLVGTLRKNRKHLPEDVKNAKLKTGEYKAKENENGITVMKWKDKRDVLLLSTKHSTKFVTTTNRRGHEKYKPEIVRDYNRTKSAIDLSDQMSAYSSPLRKTVKWYRKLAFELLLNTAVVNAMILHDITTKKSCQLFSFGKQ
jgi:hypothetical protein